MKSLQLSIIMSVGIYCLLTLPHFIACYTMDINTGHYYGLVYPLWLIISISSISGILGNLVVRKFK